MIYGHTNFAEAHVAERDLPCSCSNGPDYPIEAKMAQPKDHSIRENMLELENVLDKTSELLDCIGGLVFGVDTNEAKSEESMTYSMRDGSAINLCKARSILVRLEEIAKGLGV